MRMLLGKPRPSQLPFRRPRRILAPHERGLPLGQHRAAIATIRHDLKAGNLDHARKVARKIFEGPVDEMTPAMFQTVLAQIEVELDKAGL